MKQSAFIIGLLSLNIFLVIQLNRATRPIAAEKAFNTGITSEDGLLLIHGEENAEKPMTLYVFFHGDGSCACMDDWSNWEKMNQKYGDKVAVKGVFNGMQPEQFVNFAKGAELSIPLYLDPDGALRKRLGVAPNRVAKFLMGPRGHMLFADTHQEDPRDHKYYVKRMKRHLDYLN